MRETQSEALRCHSRDFWKIVWGNTVYKRTSWDRTCLPKKSHFSLREKETGYYQIINKKCALENEGNTEDTFTINFKTSDVLLPLKLIASIKKHIVLWISMNDTEHLVKIHNQFVCSKQKCSDIRTHSIRSSSLLVTNTQTNTYPCKQEDKRAGATDLVQGAV